MTSVARRDTLKVSAKLTRDNPPQLPPMKYQRRLTVYLWVWTRNDLLEPVLNLVAAKTSGIKIIGPIPLVQFAPGEVRAGQGDNR